MNNINRLAIGLAVALMGTSVIVTTAVAQDKAKPAAAAEKAKAAAPAKDQRDRKVLVENDKVLVTETRYKPGLSSGMLERKTRVTRALTDGTFEKTFADGRKETVTWKTGQVRYNPTETFDQKNTGKSEVVLYTVTLK